MGGRRSSKKKKGKDKAEKVDANIVNAILPLGIHGLYQEYCDSKLRPKVSCFFLQTFVLVLFLTLCRLF